MGRVISADDWKAHGIKELEPNAETVVRSTVNTLVTAGPGAGKTELLAQRASFLLETGSCTYPRRILAISFKRDAAKNLHDRVRQRSGPELARRFDSYTFDAFAKGVVDQFRAAIPTELRPSADYEILFSLQQEEVEETLLAMDPPPALGARENLRAFATRDFFSKEVPRAPLQDTPNTLREWARREFWTTLLHGSSPSRASFPMINRLAGEMFKTDPRLRRAYRATYSHVFLDEFQDSTALQYWLTRILFRESRSVLTAVGDPRQRIMGWAGALRDIFSKFTVDFAANSAELLRNHRASAEIAPVVRHLAKQLGSALGKEDAVEELLSGSGPPANACAAHVFPDEVAEAEWIAAEIDELLARGIQPRDIGILVRMKAHQYGANVIAALATKGRLARVEDEMQDLLSEPIIECVMLALRALGTHSPGTAWADFRESIAIYRGIDVDDERRLAALEKELAAVRVGFRSGYPCAPLEVGEVAEMLKTFVEPLTLPVRHRYGQYRHGSFYTRTLRKFAEVVATAASADRSWSQLLDEIDGVDAVPVLTIHKSKGLEYHAVFFVGLEDGAFWNFKRDPDEESNAFFVALSRAKERVDFSFASLRTRKGRSERQTLGEIKRLYELMGEAGVRTVDHRPPTRRQT